MRSTLKHPAFFLALFTVLTGTAIIAVAQTFSITKVSLRGLVEGVDAEAPIDTFDTLENPEFTSDETPVESSPVEEPSSPETVPSEESTPTEPAEENPGLEEPPSEEPVESAPAPEEPPPASAPVEEPIVEEPVTEELPADSEVRATLETVTPKLDWPYTLRAATDYASITVKREVVRSDFVTIITEVEANASNQVVNDQLCLSFEHLNDFQALFAIGTDDSQEELDLDNADIFTEIHSALDTVQLSWETANSTQLSCN